MFNDPAIFELAFDYLSSIGKIKTDNFIGDHGIIMNSGNIMKISIHRDVSGFRFITFVMKIFGNGMKLDLTLKCDFINHY